MITATAAQKMGSADLRHMHSGFGKGFFKHEERVKGDG